MDIISRKRSKVIAVNEQHPFVTVTVIATVVGSLGLKCMERKEQLWERGRKSEQFFSDPTKMVLQEDHIVNEALTDNCRYVCGVEVMLGVISVEGVPIVSIGSR
ncbi:hypothetical protein TNCV_1740781 [Trichonephila clavipes]|uniref:Uncharacterized protein n=1 Tax=Trichonephila clavipes TaxID=2585209 RepID=A0A8X6UY54_TRICX|nr:hypothetical protein TNCV_1740781 [Trichonephila clavipes]